MRLLLILLGLVIAQLNFPFSCDCTEHGNSITCAKHQCKWDESIESGPKCRVKKCDERGDKVVDCVTPSQFYSTNRTSCYPMGLQTQKCSPVTQCSDLDVSKISPSYGRRVCKVNFCMYNYNSKMCAKQNNCTSIPTEEECNNFFINDYKSLFQPTAYCYWAGDICKTATRFFGECSNREIKAKEQCKAHGCQWESNSCTNLNCTNIVAKDCMKEHMDSFGKIHICFLKNDKCNVTESSAIRKEDCDLMTGHTFDDELEVCKPCLSLNKYLNPIVIEEYNRLLVAVGLLYLVNA